MKIYILMDNVSDYDFESHDHELGYFSSMEKLLIEKSRLEKLQEHHDILNDVYWKVIKKQNDLAVYFRDTNPKPEYPIKVKPNPKTTLKSIKKQQVDCIQSGRMDLAGSFLEIYNNRCEENNKAHNEYHQTILPKYTAELKEWESNKVKYIEQNITELEKKILNTRTLGTIHLPLYVQEVELDCSESSEIDEEFINRVKQYKEFWI